MKNKKESNSWVAWGVILLVLIVLFFLSISIYKEFSKKKQVENDIERIAYLGSQDYQKVQAREKLDLQDPEENVVVITQDSTSLKQQDEENSELETNDDQENYSNEDISNFLKWWNYFFKN